MKKTLLQITQDILNELDSDPVNSIDDTFEASQIATIVRGCFEEMVANRNWPSQKKLIQLEASGDLTKPNYLRVPGGLKELEFFKYDKRKVGETNPNFQDVKYKDPESFLRYVSSRNTVNTNVTVVKDFSGTSLLILNDVAPSFWTSFDDNYIVTDSFNFPLDATLQKSKTQCMAYMEPIWVHKDDAIPDLPEEAFPALVEESKSVAFLTIKQMANQKAEQKAARQQRWLSRRAWKTKGGIQYENYGRRRKF